LHTFAPDGEGVWIFAGLDAVKARIAGSTVDITRTSGAYNATEDKLWTGGVLGGIPILNNGVDVPQQWGPISAGQELVNLQNWPTDWSCAAIRPFKNFLIAMNMTEDESNYIHRVRWSHPAEPGAVPISWDALDPTVDAGRFDLPDVNSGKLVDGASLRDIFVLGKEKALWGMQFVGGTQKFRVFSIAEFSGVMTKNCMVPTADGQLLFIATGEDLVVTNGVKLESVVDQKVRRWLQGNIEGAFFNRSFCAVDGTNGECWFCFPTGGSLWPNMALVWNRTANSISFRDLPLLSYASGGVVPAVSELWSQATRQWSEDLRRWTELSHQPFLRPLVGVAPTTSRALAIDLSTAAVNSYVERTGLSIAGMNSSGIVNDPTRRKLVKRVYMEGRGGLVNIKVGTQTRIGEPTTWSAAKPFNLANGVAADFHENGVLWGIRIESDSSYRVDRIVVDVEDVGGAF
jgi:hypothetical protein